MEQCNWEEIDIVWWIIWTNIPIFGNIKTRNENKSLSLASDEW